MSRALLAFLAFLAAVFFFGWALFGGSDLGFNEPVAGLFCTALGLAIGSAPA